MNRGNTIILSLNLVSGFIFGMQSNNKQDKYLVDGHSSAIKKQSDEQESHNIKTLSMEQVAQQVLSTLPVNNFATESITHNIKQYVVTPSNSEIEDYNDCYSNAPSRLKALLVKEKSNSETLQRSNRIILIGEPGTGKSLLAKAIAYRLGSKCYFLTSGVLTSKNRGGSGEKLHAIIEQIKNENEKSVLVIDELNLLVDNYTSENRDTRETAAVLWTNLDALKSNKNFFFVATLNESKKIHPTLQTRFQRLIFEIPFPDKVTRRRRLEKLLNQNIISCDPALKNYLPQLVDKTDKFTQRDLDTLIGDAEIMAYEENENKPVLRPLHFDRVLNEWKQEKEKYWNFKEEISAEDRRHQESLAQSRELHEKNSELQRQALILQEKSFNTQIKLHEENIQIQLEGQFQQEKMHRQNYRLHAHTVTEEERKGVKLISEDSQRMPWKRQ